LLKCLRHEYRDATAGSARSRKQADFSSAVALEESDSWSNFLKAVFDTVFFLVEGVWECAEPHALLLASQVELGVLLRILHDVLELAR
jgi:hypothetical protein